MLCCQFNNQNWQTLRSSEKNPRNQLIDEKTRKLPSAKASVHTKAFCSYDDNSPDQHEEFHCSHQTKVNSHHK